MSRGVIGAPPTAEEIESLGFGVKEEIRRRRRSLRKTLPQAAREARSEKICQRVLSLPEWQSAEVVLAFVSMRTEVQTQVAVTSAWEAGKVVATTRMNETFDDLDLREWRRDGELEESGMMFLQPTADSAAVRATDVDLVLVPALALDPTGHRIGYGKGFYDRLLPRLTKAVRVGVIFDFERIAEVPARPEDEPVHVIVTDERIERPADSAAG